MKPAYLRQIPSGDCFAFSPHLEARKDMVEWTGPLPWEKKEKQVKEASVEVKVATAIKIPREAITIDPVKPEAPAQVIEKPVKRTSQKTTRKAKK